MRKQIESADSIDVADVVRTVRRGWPAVVGFIVLGMVGAGAILAFAPRKFDAHTFVVIKAANDRAGLLSRLPGMGDLLAGDALGTKAMLKTEIQVLQSRQLGGRVVDSLKLQTEPRSPRRIAAAALVSSVDLPGSFAPRRYRFERQQNGVFQATSEAGDRHVVTPGQPGAIGVGTLTLQTTGLPPSFELLVLDREDAITALHDRLTVNEATGEVARIGYRDDDSLSAAAVPNALLAFYLERRRTVDRGTNAERSTFLSRQVDSTATELAAAERALRQHQESSGVLDALTVGKVEIERAALLRKGLAEIEVEEGAINQLLEQAAGGTLTRRQLAAFPTFLKGSSLSPLVGQISELEAQRLQLLERRTETDPEVVALDQSIRSVENQFQSLARSYAASLGRQRVELRGQIDSLQAALMTLPAVAESGNRLQRDVVRLSQIYGALQAQLVQARLAAIGEGGDVRQLDPAVPPREPAFPKPLMTIGVGTVGGLVAGLIAALVLGWFGPWVRDPAEIERLMGVNAQRLAPGAPLLLRAGAAARVVLVVPVEARALPQAGLVAQQLIRNAAQRSVSATMLDLTGDNLPAPISGNGNHAGGAVASAIAALEREHGLVVVRLPSLTDDTTLAAMDESRPVMLVAAPGPVYRAKLENAVEVLRRLEMPCAGIVISDTTPRLRSLS